MLKLIEYFNRRAKENRVYILPTFLGIKLFIVNIILLSMGLVYANNYLIMFGFIFLCLFIVSMFYTHLNLYGLKIEEVIVSDGHANEAINVGLKFRNIRSEEHPALFIKLYSKSSIIGGNIFCIDSNGLSSEILVYFPNRGRYLFDRIEISTLFPLKLFKAFIYFDFNIEVIVYPELVTGFKLGDIYSLTHSKEDLDVEIRNYRLGDQINRIAWKKSFENNLRTKIEVGQDDTAILFYVGFDDTKDVEEEIKLTATSIKACFDQNRSFGVKTKDQTISIDVPNLLHVKKCLNLLAVYES